MSAKLTLPTSSHALSQLPLWLLILCLILEHGCSSWICSRSATRCGFRTFPGQFHSFTWSSCASLVQEVPRAMSNRYWKASPRCLQVSQPQKWTCQLHSASFLFAAFPDTVAGTNLHQITSSKPGALPHFLPFSSSFYQSLSAHDCNCQLSRDYNHSSPSPISYPSTVHHHLFPPSWFLLMALLSLLYSLHWY